MATYQSGRVVSVSRYDKDANSLGSTTFAYDAHGRQARVTDARTGSTDYAFDAADRITAVTNPPPVAGQSAPVVQTQYDAMGRATNVIQADLTSTFTQYTSNGLPWKTWGSRTYPAQYGYDAER